MYCVYTLRTLDDTLYIGVSGSLHEDAKANSKDGREPKKEALIVGDLITLNKLSRCKSALGSR